MWQLPPTIRFRVLTKVHPVTGLDFHTSGRVHIRQKIKETGQNEVRLSKKWFQAKLAEFGVTGGVQQILERPADARVSEEMVRVLLEVQNRNPADRDPEAFVNHMMLAEFVPWPDFYTAVSAAFEGPETTRLHSMLMIMAILRYLGRTGTKDRYGNTWEVCQLMFDDTALHYWKEVFRPKQTKPSAFIAKFRDALANWCSRDSLNAIVVAKAKWSEVPAATRELAESCSLGKCLTEGGAHEIDWIAFEEEVGVYLRDLAADSFVTDAVALYKVISSPRKRVKRGSVTNNKRTVIKCGRTHASLGRGYSFLFLKS